MVISIGAARSHVPLDPMVQVANRYGKLRRC
jgi:hypothetical protein